MLFANKLLEMHKEICIFFFSFLYRFIMDSFLLAFRLPFGQRNEMKAKGGKGGDFRK
jgi:hypothetical protein